MFVFFLALIIVSPATTALGQAGNNAPEMAGSRVDIDVYGNFVLLDTERNLVKLYSKDGALMREIGGSGWENSQFDKPSGLWARNGIDIFVADYGNHRIQRFDRGLNFISSFATRENSNPDQRFGYPTDVALSRLGDLFICDGENSRIVKVNRFSRVERTFGGFDAGKGRLTRPTNVEIGPHDYVYVLDGKRIVVFDSFGNYIHDLASGVFTNPVGLYANGIRIIVVDETGFYCFNEDERPDRVVALASVQEKYGNIQSIAIGGSSLYLLTERGLQAEPDPCGVDHKPELDN